MRRGKWTAVAAMVASAALVLAACGSDNDETDAGATDTGTATEEATDEAPPEDTGEEAPADTGEEAPEESPAPSEGGAFQFGYVLPETGDLAFLGPPQIEAMKYAISLIDEAGGINGQPVAPVISGDEANDAALAAQAASAEINAGVNAIIGAAATGMTMAIIESVTGAEIAQCSGSNTGVILTDYPGKMGPDGKQYYFRTAPSDALQGPVLGDLVLNDGHTDVAVLFRNDDYGKGLADATASAIEAGGGTVLMNEGYDIKSPDFAGLVQKVANEDPDAVVTVSFDEGFQLWSQLFDAGLTPDKVGIYGADGMRSSEAPEKNFASNPGIVDGAGGTAPASVENPDFINALKEFAPDLEETQFAPQIFDCVNIFALAAQAAGTNNTPDWVPLVIDVTKDGTECNTYAECSDLIAAGEDIHYVGAAGDLSFTDKGEPGKAQIEIWRYQDGGKLVSEGVENSSF